MDKLKDAIPALIIVNLIFFAVTSLAPSLEMYEWFGLYFPRSPHFKYWQFITNMFMHGGFTHILFNMYALWAFGSPLEHIWGKKRFLLFYFLSGVGAAIIYTLVNYYQFNVIYQELTNLGFSAEKIQGFLTLRREEVLSSQLDENIVRLWQIFNIPAVGASGAIYGVLVAFGILFPNSKLMLIFLPFPIAAKYFIPILIALDLFSGLTGFSIFGAGIAHFGHIGGAIIGFLLMMYWRNRDRLRRPTSSFE